MAGRIKAKKMKYIADLHLHSKYSRATAKNLDFENLYTAAQIKGVTVVGTGDFTHPEWRAEIEDKLEPAEPGLFRLRSDIARQMDNQVPESCRGKVRFILQSEISNIYKKNDRVRKNHNLVYFPDLDSVKKFNAVLGSLGNIKSDGRPILGLDAAELLSIMLDVNDKGMFVPAHIWTPWFSLFGSKSGFDTMEECFGDLTRHIFAVETGLSSDPPMNWRIEQLDDIRLLSSSDAHSPGYLGRNASVFNTDLSFEGMRRALKENDLEAYQGTLDMFPHQGKYHYDGHRKCNICLNPATTERIDAICPECGKPLTLGVLYRVQQLASRPEGYVPESRHGFKSIIPLVDILSEIFEVGPKTKKVAAFYQKAVETLGPELDILVEQPIEQIEKASVPFLAEAVKKMRAGDIDIDPGYDGEYGVVNIFTREEKERLKGEKNLLFDLPRPKKRSKTRIKQIGSVKSRRKAVPVRKKPEEKDENVLSGLNPEQRSAVETSARAVIVQAGPGTGKTRTLTARIAWLVAEKKVAPDRILALTFTNKAAKELNDRIKTFMPEKGKTVLAATFHAFCLKMLREYQGFSGSILDEPTRLNLVRQAMEGHLKKSRANRVDQLISLCKQRLLSPGDDLLCVEGVSEIEAFTDIFDAYHGLCREENAVDFEDLICLTAYQLKNNPHFFTTLTDRFDYIFIDEYQDLNYGQYQLTKMLASNSHIFVIGDPDQSIYGFRGSDNAYFARFETDFQTAQKIYLSKNYRSSQTILDASFQMISKAESAENAAKIYSDIDGSRYLLIKETASEFAEAVAIGKMIEKLVGGTSFFSMDSGRMNDTGPKEYSFSDFAILYRTGRQCEALVQAFEKEGIPCQTADKKRLVELEGIRELISLCRITAGRATLVDLNRAADLFDMKLIGPPEMIRKQYHRLNERDNALETLQQDLPDEDGLFFERLFDLSKSATGRTVADILDVFKKQSAVSTLLDGSKALKQAYDTIRQQAEGFDSVGSFLDTLSLDRDADTLEKKAEKVSLMTLHAAKGLEFPVVFICGCEQGFIPFAKDGKTIDDPEEERRLFYVGMTRAMDILCLTYAKKRSIYGTKQKRQRSLFIRDIERQLLQEEKSAHRMPVKKKEQQLELF